jgi:hypothetical protein
VCVCVCVCDGACKRSWPGCIRYQLLRKCGSSSATCDLCGTPRSACHSPAGPTVCSGGGKSCRCVRVYLCSLLLICTRSSLSRPKSCRLRELLCCSVTMCLVAAVVGGGIGSWLFTQRERFCAASTCVRKEFTGSQRSSRSTAVHIQQWTLRHGVLRTGQHSR